MSDRRPTTAKVTLASSGAEITMYHDPLLKLFAISDCSNLGPHVVRVKLDGRGLYETEYLLGGDEEGILPVARYLAPLVFGSHSRDIEEAGQDVNSLDPCHSQEVLMSISLRKHDGSVMRELGDLLKKQPNILQPLQPVTLSSHS